VHEPQCQLINHVALVQLDSVNTEPMDACNALTAPSEGVRREHVNGLGVVQSHGLHVLTKHAHHPGQPLIGDPERDVA
jgi:hypothetical protein